MAKTRPDHKHVASFVTGMVYDYWKNAYQQPPLGERFEEFLSDSIAKVWAYVTEDRSTRDFHDYQCVIAIEARQVFGTTVAA